MCSTLLLWLLLLSLVACSTTSSSVARQDPPRTPAAQATNTAGAATPASTPPDISARLRIVNGIIAHMTLEQELGQLFVVEYLYTDANHPDLANMIGTMGAGGVILYQSLNIKTIPQTRQLTSAMQAAAHIPLIIGADEEGGGDDQTSQIFGPHPTEWDIGQTNDPSAAARFGTRLAGELKQLGLNTDFAPVVDVLSPTRGWLRAFSRSPQMVGQMGAAEVDALQQGDIMACLKHFPGLGAANINPHQGLPVINSSRSYLEQVDFAPYRALMSHQPAMIMTTDLLMPALDPTVPAELSYPIVTGILRNEIGYNGVVITDALYMGGISQHYSMPEAAVLSILAGNDMLEGAFDSGTMGAMVAALRDAVHSGRLTKDRLDASVRRILLLKQHFGMLPSTLPRDALASLLSASGSSIVSLPAPSPLQATLPRSYALIV
jgi:beta-N-acetylhexosaminidase